MNLRATLEGLRNFDTALLANTIGYTDATPAHEYYMSRDIQSVTPSLAPTVAVAVTCECDSSTPGGKAEMDAFWKMVEDITDMDVPAIWVVKTVGSRPQHECVLGDGMAKILCAAGCVGAVTDGGVRDVSGLAQARFAAYCRGTTVHHCAVRIRRVEQAVQIGGITVNAGDVIHADGEGVIRIPPTCLANLASDATRMVAFEHDIHGILARTDIPPSDKRKSFGELIKRHGFKR